MLDLVSETAPQVERLGVEDAPAKKTQPRRPSASPNPLPSEQFTIPSNFTPVDERQIVEPVSPQFVASPPPQSLATGEILRVAAMVLSARALVLIFGLCGFTIALIAALHESREVLWVFVAWNMLTVIPAIALEMRQRGD